MKKNALLNLITTKVCPTLLLLFVFFSGTTANENRILFNRLGVNQGLSSNEINSILKDRRGFMWFGTPEGLNCYDGYEFTCYKPERNDYFYAEEYIIHMVETQDDKLWLTYQNGSIRIFDLRENKFYSMQDICRSLHLPSTISHVFQEAEGNLLFATADHRLCKYDYTTASIIDYPTDLTAGKVSDVVCKDAYLYVVYYTGVVDMLDLNRRESIKSSRYLQSKTHYRRYHLFVDTDGEIWIYSDPHSGLFHFTPLTDQWEHFSESSLLPLSSSIVREVEEGEDGVIWVATDHGGINLIDKKKRSISYLKNNHFDARSISQNSVISLYKDDTGVIWAGTYKNGVNYYHESIFKFYTFCYPITNELEAGINDSNCVYEDRWGNLYIGTNGHGLLCYNRATGTYKKYVHNPSDPYSIRSNVIVSMAADKWGNIWLGTYTGGMDCFDGERFIHYQWDKDSQNGVSDNNIYTLYIDEKDYLWIGTLGKGIDRLDLNTKEWKHFFVSEENLQANNVYTIAKGEEGQLYIGTTSGLYILDTATEKITPFTTGKENYPCLQGKIIHAVYQDNDGVIWIGTNHGLDLYDVKNEVSCRINKSKGLPDNNIVSITKDVNGHLWLGTKNGLAQLIPSGTEPFTFDIRSYYENEGVQGPQFNRNSLCYTASGELVFGGVEGVTIFDPLKMKYNLNPPQIAVTFLEIQNRKIEPGGCYDGKVLLKESIRYASDLILDYKDRNFTLNVAALNYIFPRKSNLTFKMEGFDETWTTVDASSRSITYMNMSPGSYLFKVKAENNDKVQNSETYQLKITILPPFWMTTWAILLYVVLLLGSAVLVFRIVSHLESKKSEKRQQQLLIDQKHEMDEMKLRFFTNVSHEFRTPLTLIVSPLERLIKKDTDPENITLLKLIHQNANQLLSMVNQLLDFRKLDMQGHVLTLSVGDIIPFIRDIVYSFKELSGRKNIRFFFSSSFNSLPMEFDKEKVYKIIVNLLSNAFKFTPEGGEIKVNVSLSYSTPARSEELIIQVIDTGIGIKQEDQSRIFERFYQSIDPEKDNHSQGTGIGLHLCQEFVKLHGGKITVESELGKGSVFTVSLPFHNKKLHEISHAASSATAEEAAYSLNKENISVPDSGTDMKDSKPALVVIDDNADFRKFMILSLQDEFSVGEAPDGESGWELILNEMPDMIVCDVMMPGIDGFELCRKVKNDLRTSHIPVILLTAKSGEESKIAGLESGADDYIGKPFNMDMLILKIRRTLDIRVQMQKRILQFSSSGIRLSDVKVNSLDEELIKKAVSYIEEHLSDPQLSVEKISREMGMSRVNFYKKTLSMTGKSPVELIRMIRIHKAGKLLENGHMRVSEVMLEVGINDIKLFRKYFKEEFGVPPSNYTGNK